MTGALLRRVAVLYLVWNRSLGSVFSLVRGVVDGLFLGLASRRALHVLDETFYATQPQYLGEEYTRSGWKDWEQDVVDRYFGGCSDVLVTGAGGGREVLALQSPSRRATGFECNAEMVAFGQRVLTSAGGQARLLPAPRDGWPELAGSFDGVIIGWGSYTHIAGRTSRVEFLRRARQHVVVGAPLLVSVYARPHGHVYHRAVRVVGSGLRRVRHEPPLDLGDGLAPMYAHHFTRAELASELVEAGFDLVEWVPTPFAHAVARARGTDMEVA